MKTFHLDLSARNERDEILLAAGSPRRNLQALGLRYGDRIYVRDPDLLVEARVITKPSGVVAQIDWDTVKYK